MNERRAGGPRDRKFLCRYSADALPALCSHTQCRKQVDTHTSKCFVEEITHTIQFRFCWRPLTQNKSNKYTKWTLFISFSVSNPKEVDCGIARFADDEMKC